MSEFSPLDLDTIGQVVREGTAPADLLAGVVTTPLPDLVDQLREANRRLVTCPYCHKPVAGLLALCRQPDCLKREIADDHRFARSQDI